jgi:hypothetical protein
VFYFPAENSSSDNKVITMIGDPHDNVLLMHESEVIEMILDCDDMFGEIPDNFQFLLEVDGASAQDLESGLADGRQVLESHGIDPRPAFRASQIAGVMYGELSDANPSLADLEPWKEWCRLADVWDAASDAALEKATQNLTPGEIVLCQFILDSPDRFNKLGTFCKFPYKVGAEYGKAETYSASFEGLYRFVKDSDIPGECVTPPN